MIPSRKHPWFRRWFAGHAETKLRAGFERVGVRGLSNLTDALREGPVVIVSNHVCWWDPLVALWVTARLAPHDSHAMMDAANLTKLPFFGLVGAFGVDRTNPSDGAAAMRYAARLLSEPGRSVWIFPQGAERPSTQRPLGFLRGSAEIARVAKARTVPLALRYEFRGTERPHLFVDVGEAFEPVRNVEEGRLLHERRVTDGLDRIDAALRADDVTEYVPAIQTPESALGVWATRALAWMTRPGGVIGSAPLAP